MRVRLATLLLVVASASAAQADGRDKLLLVVNRAEDKVSVFKADGPTLTLIKALPVGKTPREVCVSPDGKRAYVSAQEGHLVTALDLDTLTVGSTFTAPNLKSPDGCVVSPDSKKLYVVSMGSNALFAIDAADGRVLKEIPLPLKVPRRVVYTPDAKRLFVGCNQTPEIAVIDAATDTTARTFKVGNEARGGLAFSADGATFYVGNVEDDTVSWVDMATLEVKRVVGVPISPQRIEVSADGETGFVLTRVGGRDAAAAMFPVVFAMPLKKPHDASRSIPVGKAPWGLTMNGDRTVLYASSNTDDNVTIIDARTLKVLATVPVGKDPNGLAFRP
jgi:YVTN family beta-propeller protein